MERVASPSSSGSVRLPAQVMEHLPTELRYAPRLLVLPPRVARFQWRARQLAHRHGDAFSLMSATRPSDLGRLLRLARGRRRVVELGTATGWTAIALAIADSRRRVTTFDPVPWPNRNRYLELIGPGVGDRIEYILAPGASGPLVDTPVELLYIDSSHAREDTIAELRAWYPALSAGALIVLDDYDHPHFPGVREAVRAFGLDGRRHGSMYVHERH